MLTVKQWKLLFHVFSILLLFFIGFFTGRNTIKTKETIKTEYIKGDTITNTIFEPKPEYIEKPIDTLNVIKDCINNGIYKELWPNKIITEYVKITSEDTVKIINDWASKRKYNELLFENDTIGKCNVQFDIQYNRLKLLSYVYEPVVKNVVEQKIHVKKFSPFIGLGYLTNPWDEFDDPLLNFSIGTFYKEKYGLQLHFMHKLNTNKDYIGGTFLYKF
jgi:hypothetical protein